jgi:hypothetical protein
MLKYVLLALALISPAYGQAVIGGGGTVAPNLYAAPGNGEATRFTSTAGQVLASTTITANTFVMIIPGQSLGGSHVQANYVATGDCRAVNFTGDRKLYKDNTGNEEMGSTFSPRGYQGWAIYSSMWPKLCDQLMGTTSHGRVIDSVIIINPSSAGQPIAQFMPSGPLGYLLPLAFFTLNELGIPPWRVDVIIPMEGEADGIAGTPQGTYQTAMQTWFTVAANFGFVGKWIIPQESYAYGCTSTAIRAAQLAVTDGITKIQGPDLDTFVGATNRYAESATAGCAVNALVHPNATGETNITGALKTTIYANF